jgi:hypothetical protein
MSKMKPESFQHSYGRIKEMMRADFFINVARCEYGHILSPWSGMVCPGEEQVNAVGLIIPFICECLVHDSCSAWYPVYSSLTRQNDTLYNKNGDRIMLLYAKINVFLCKMLVYFLLIISRVNFFALSRSSLSGWPQLTKKNLPLQ